MKIAILVQSFPPKWTGGIEIATYNTARHLALENHDVHVITSLDEGLPKESADNGFHVHRISRQKLGYVEAILFWARTFLLIRNIKPDIVHVQTVVFGIPGVLAKWLLRKPYIVWGRGSDIYMSWPFKRIISQLVLRNAGAVVALTGDMKREMQKVCNRDITVIPNGIDLDGFQGITRQEARGEMQIEEDKKVIIFVGRLSPVKGVKYLIQALDILRHKETSIKLLIVGDGEQRDELVDQVAKLDIERYITFIGEVSNEQVPKYMATSDIFVLPSLSEGFPNVCLEAMASGLPVIATKVGGLVEIIRDGQNGFLVNPETPREIAEKISLLLEDDELRERISSNNMEMVKDYSWQVVVRRLEKVYRNAY